MKICAIIVAYNNPEELKVCIESILLNRSYAEIDLFVTDNSSMEIQRKNVELLSHMKGVYYCPLEENFGSSFGYSLGMYFATTKKYDFIWLVDQDGYVDKRALLYLLRHKDEGDILCPRVLSIEAKNKELKIFRIQKNIFGKPVYFKESAPKNFFYFGSHGVLIKEQVINELGFFDINHYFVGLEDWDFSVRARKNNFKIISVHEAKVYHPDLEIKHNNKNMKIKTLFKYVYFRNILPFFLNVVRKFEKNNNNRAYSSSFFSSKYNFFLIHLFNFLFSSMIICIEKLFDRNIDLKITFLSYFKGTIDGIKEKRNYSIFKNSKIFEEKMEKLTKF